MLEQGKGGKEHPRSFWDLGFEKKIGRGGGGKGKASIEKTRTERENMEMWAFELKGGK